MKRIVFLLSSACVSVVLAQSYTVQEPGELPITIRPSYGVIHHNRRAGSRLSLLGHQDMAP